MRLALLTIFWGIIVLHALGFGLIAGMVAAGFGAPDWLSLTIATVSASGGLPLALTALSKLDEL